MYGCQILLVHRIVSLRSLAIVDICFCKFNCAFARSSSVVTPEVDGVGESRLFGGRLNVLATTCVICFVKEDGVTVQP